jgi:hypothetical protein
MINYACIKNNIVENTLVFEETNLEFIQQVKETFSYNELIEIPADLIVETGYLYDGTDFYIEEGKKAVYLDNCEYGDPEHSDPEHGQSEQGDDLEA